MSITTPTPAGELRHRVTILTRGSTTNELGEAIEGYTPGATVWAKVEPLSQRERVADAQNAGNSTHRVTLRYTAGLAHTDRLSYGGRVFHIEELINRDEQGRELVALCHEQN